MTSVSPVSFMMAKEGELVQIRHTPSKKNEYRANIGPPADCYLVFKGQTKIGMIPKTFVNQNKQLMRPKNCRIKKMDQSKSVIIIDY